jgi:glyoxylase-like metal-dependent hydrolase (beta-lactamase superfamily II)
VTWERVDLGFVSAYVVVRDGEAAVIDTGEEGSAGDIERTLAATGTGWGDVGHVILTHLHGDHIGSLPEVMTSAPDATAYAHAADIPGILSPRPISPVADEDTIFGLTIIHTPGHTPGHISLLDSSLDVLFAGDAINGANPGVTGPNPRFTPEMGLAIESARRLGTFDYDTVVFGHGEPVAGGADAAVAAMAAGL